MNANDRLITIHFNNQSRLDLSFPKQIKDSVAAVMESIKRAMEADKLAIETEDRLLVIPWTSVKLIEVTPVPPALPFGAIRNARIVDTRKTD